MDSPSFDISIARDGNHFTLCVTGELDMATSPVLMEKLDDALTEGAHRIILDFYKLEYIDSEGIRALIPTYMKLQDMGGSLSIVGCHSGVARIFQVLGIEDRFCVSRS